MARTRSIRRIDTGGTRLQDGPGETLRLALRAVAAVHAAESSAPFLVRRAAAAALALEGERERSSLVRLLDACDARLPAVRRAEAIAALLALTGLLESRARLEEAEACVALARVLDAERPELQLHAGRIARKRGDVEAARAAYRAVRGAAGEAVSLARMAAIGEALLDPEPVPALSRVAHSAIRAGEREAAALAAEERARARRASGDRTGAVRDLLVAAARYPDPVDRARTALGLADLLSAGGDLLGAREALFLAFELGRPEQRDHVRGRLHHLSRTLGDELGSRRWRPTAPAPLVSLLPSRPSTGRSSAAPVVARWRERILPAAAACMA